MLVLWKNAMLLAYIFLVVTVQDTAANTSGATQGFGSDRQYRGIKRQARRRRRRCYVHHSQGTQDVMQWPFAHMADVTDGVATTIRRHCSDDSGTYCEELGCFEDSSGLNLLYFCAKSGQKKLLLMMDYVCSCEGSRVMQAFLYFLLASSRS